MIGVFGGGAMGRLFAHLSKKQVHMLVRTSEQAQQLNQSGILWWDPPTVKASKGVVAYTDVKQMPPLDVAVLAVKQYNLEEVLPLALQTLKPYGKILTLQNGISSIKHHKMVQGVWYAGARLDSQGVLRIAGQGMLHTEQPLPIDIPHSVGNFPAEQKRKLVINSVINPLTAWLKVPNGELLKYPNFLQQLLKESNSALGTQVSIEDLHQVILATAENHSSMLQDVLQGKPTELEWICGRVAKPNTLHGVFYQRLMNSQSKKNHTYI